MKPFGQRLKDLRTENNFTQEELAKKLGVTRQSIAKWEEDTYEPDMSTIVAIVKLFGVSSDYLLGLVDY